MTTAIQKTIDEVKKREGVFLEDKEKWSNELDALKDKKAALQAKVDKLRADKNEAKEDFYARMIAYEVQQKTIRDIEWLK